MREAKIALTAVAILAIIGGSLAFKADRIIIIFYKYTTSVINGRVTGICDQNQTVRTALTTVAVGGFITTISISPAQSVTTCTARVTIIL